MEVYKETSGLIVVDFYSDWCVPCKVIVPIIEKLEKEFPDIKFFKVDIKELPDLAESFDIKSMPTLVVLYNNQEMERIVGTFSEDYFRRAFRKYMDVIQGKRPSSR